MKIPSISVITPSYNTATFIEDAMLSVARQSGVTVEHIVIDGASTDATLEIVKRHPQVQWISESDRGQSDAINKGFLRASGDLVGWLNADDYYLPGALEAVARAARDYPEADVFYGDCVFVNGEGTIVRSKVEHEFDPTVLLYFGCYIPSTSTFFRREVIDSGLLLDCDYRVCMDFEYFARLAAAGRRFHYLPRVLAAFRWHGSNVSLLNAQRRVQERAQVQQRFCGWNGSKRFMTFLADAARGRRLLRKAASGNLTRELRLRRMTGQDTRWTQAAEARQTCQTLACL
ncbi:MAG TPA: glycosyltransferase family 2 protein [Candidatus Bathyarchaeia archaeon]|nr:glycosyltransferase family 2 protein [Candidatus Bathyarchaeia archaeon]